MIFHLFRRSPQDDSIASLYGMIVAQARAQAFYQAYGVPDTVNGRFEMIVLHLVLVLHRLKAEPEGRRLGQAVFDLFCSDMDANLREMGVGDLAVPRTMQDLGGAFYGRQAAYEAALAAAEPGPLVAALARNVFAGETGPGAVRLAAYVRETNGDLATQDGRAVSKAELRFPRLESVTADGRR
jgi:cytochrome b pre-mRNA-processing protein 3